MEKHEIIYKLYPQVLYINNEIAYDKDNNEVIIDSELIENELNKIKYIALRQQEYPSITDQLDYIYHNGIDAWKTDMIDPVKTKYPKGVA